MSNVRDTRQLFVEVKKGGCPFLCFAFAETFNALFMYKKVGFFVSADGLSRDEFVSVISSLLK